MTRWTESDLEAFRKRQGHATPKPKPQTRKRSELEVQMEYQLRANGLDDFVLQHKPLLPRKWSLDFAWPHGRVGIEVQGMVHRIKGKFKRDIEKRAALLLAGWRVLEVDGEAIKDGRAIAWAQRLVK